MALLLKYRESQHKSAALIAHSHDTAKESVKITRRFTALEVLPKPDQDKQNAIGQQLHAVEMRSGGVIAFRVPLYQKMLVGGISGVIGLTTVFPLDLIKTRLQISNVAAGGLSSVCRDVFAKYGIGGFYRGTTAVMVFPEKAVNLV